jgi:predicted Zn-dependent peptidase
MLFKGTKKYPKYQEILYKLKQMGVISNAYTTNECTAYHYTYIPALTGNTGCDKLTEFIVDMTIDMLFNSLILSSELDKEKNVVLQEYYDDKDEDQGSRTNTLYDILYGDHPINQKPIGTEDIIKGVTSEKLRKFYKKHYKYDNMFVMAAGNIPANLSEIISKCVDRVGCDANNANNAKNSMEKVDVSNIVKSLPNIDNVKIPSREVHFIKSINNQNSLYLIFPIEHGYNNTELLELNLLMRVLAGGMAGRLNFAVRENRGLVYSISTDKDIFEDAGFFYINTQNIPENSGEIIDIILKELTNIKKLGVKQDELSGVVNSYTDTLLMNANEVSFPIELYMDDVLYNHMPILDIKSRIEKMHSITLDTLNKFIERYINFDNLLVVCVGNTINKSQICRSLRKHKLNFKKIDNK